ncbi:MAG: thiamine phosphate synthase [Xanthobacteraceae bacterium]|nr:thiamine phosphate synthase [Xanthobacteraceae bacterium]
MLDQLDLRLYAILDRERAGGHALPELARKLAAGGATLVQLRDKKSDPRAQVALARAVKAALGEVPLIINDHVDVAIESGAAGVHLGQDDTDVAMARERLGPVPFIGLTIKTPAQAWAAPLRLIDYVGIGGVFATGSKNNPDPPIGLEGLNEIARIFRHRMGNFPMCAIAGITAENAGAVIEAGADGVSVISALSLAPDPTAAACALRAVVDAALVRCAPRVPAVGAAHHH